MDGWICTSYDNEKRIVTITSIFCEYEMVVAKGITCDRV